MSLRDLEEDIRNTFSRIKTLPKRATKKAKSNIAGNLRNISKYGPTDYFAPNLQTRKGIPAKVVRGIGKTIYDQPVSIGKKIGDWSKEEARTIKPRRLASSMVKKKIPQESLKLGAGLASLSNPAAAKTAATYGTLRSVLGAGGRTAEDVFKGKKITPGRRLKQSFTKTTEDMPTVLAKGGLYSATNPLASKLPVPGGETFKTAAMNVGEDVLTSKVLGWDPKMSPTDYASSFLTPYALKGLGAVAKPLANQTKATLRTLWDIGGQGKVDMNRLSNVLLQPLKNQERIEVSAPNGARRFVTPARIRGISLALMKDNPTRGMLEDLENKDISDLVLQDLRSLQRQSGAITPGAKIGGDVGGEPPRMETPKLDQRARAEVPSKPSVEGISQPETPRLSQQQITESPKVTADSLDTLRVSPDETFDSSVTDYSKSHNVFLKRGGGEGGVETKWPGFDFENWNDKLKGIFGMGRETMPRNIEDVAGKDAEKVKDFLIKPLRENDTSRVKWLNETRSTLESKLKDWNIKKGSKEDALVQRYGEGRISLKELKRETDNWRNVVDAAGQFRQLYDQLLGSLNAERAKYNYDPIPKRQDYFRHFQEIGFAGRVSGIFTNRDTLPTEIAGLTHIFSPGKPFTSASIQRKGGPFTESAIKGIDNYLDSISRQLFHIDSVQRGRQLEKAIRKAAEDNKDINLPAFTANLHEWTNIVSGKSTRFDRAFEDVSGREMYRLANTLKSRVSANMVGGNVSSALTNYIPLTQSLATTSKPAAAMGLWKSAISPVEAGKTEIDGVESRFLTRRFKKESIDPRGMEKAKELAGWLFEAVDKFTARAIVGGKFYEGLQKGLTPEEAMEQADNYAVRLMAQREIGELPNLINTRALGFLTQFQTEVNNQASFLAKDIPNMNKGNAKKVAWTLAQVALYSHLYNNLSERVLGRRVAIDPIEYIKVMLGIGEEQEGKNIVERTAQVGGDVLGNVPFVGSRLPIKGTFPSPVGLQRGASNIAEGETEKGARQLWHEAKKPLFYYGPPVGGGQIKKTMEGLSAFDKGESVTPAGNKRFDIPATLPNLVRTGLFGQWSVPEAGEYINKLQGGSKPSGKLKRIKKLKPIGGSSSSKKFRKVRFE